MKLSIGLHVIVGLAFLGLVIVHLRQRKNRIRGLMAHFKTAANWAH
jgi:heme/copper-type cytochrome/quinol oxidase subunit 3